MQGSEKEGKKGKVMIAFSIIGILLGSTMLVGMARASTLNFTIPIPNQGGITLSAVASNGRMGGGDSLLFDVTVTACSAYASESIVSVTVKAYSDSNFDSNTLTYARVGFHHQVVPAGACTSDSKTVRVHHASAAMADSSAYIVASGSVKRDGVALSANDVYYENIAKDIAALLAP